MVYTALLCACVVIKANESSSLMYCCTQSSVHVCVAAVWVLSDLTCSLFSVAVAVIELYPHFLYLIQSLTVGIATLSGIAGFVML